MRASSIAMLAGLLLIALGLMGSSLGVLSTVPNQSIPYKITFAGQQIITENLPTCVIASSGTLQIVYLDSGSITSAEIGYAALQNVTLNPKLQTVYKMNVQPNGTMAWGPIGGPTIALNEYILSATLSLPAPVNYVILWVNDSGAPSGQSWWADYLIPPQYCTSTGTLQGYVTDTSGTPIAGASVTFVSYPEGANTNSQGFYQITNIPPGTYQVSATYTHYNYETITVTIYPGKTTNQNFMLTAQVPQCGTAYAPPNCPTGFTAIVNGTISNFLSGYGVQGVVVSLTGQNYNQNETTDFFGHFSFTLQYPGSYTLTLSKPGYLSYSVPISVSSNLVYTENLKIYPNLSSPQFYLNWLTIAGGALFFIGIVLRVVRKDE
jgi:hypothetical protein